MKFGEYVDTLRVSESLRRDHLARICFKMIIFGYPFFIFLKLLLDSTLLSHPLFSTVSEFIPSLAELLSVFVGLTGAYSVERANNERLKKKANKNILTHIQQELLENNKIISKLYSIKNQDNLQYYLKTNNWEIYQDSLSLLPGWDLTLITEVYHNLNLLNKYIEKYPTVKSYNDSHENELYKTIYSLKKKTKKDIEKMLKGIENAYNSEFDLKMIKGDYFDRLFHSILKILFPK